MTQCQIQESIMPTDSSYETQQNVHDPRLFKLNHLKGKFGGISETEDIINDFSCALKRDILIHGRIFIGLENFYFYSNILGYETKVADKWCNIISLQKARLANIIPNAIKIETTDTKYLFASFSYRMYALSLMEYAVKNCKEQLNEKANDIRERVKRALTPSTKHSNLGKSQSKISLLNDEMSDIEKESTESVNSSRLLLTISKTQLMSEVMKKNCSRRESKCCCEHFEIILFHKIYQVNIDSIFNAIYDDDSSLMKEVYIKHKIEDNKIISRKVEPDGTVVRESSHIFPNAFMGKDAKTTVYEIFPGSNKSNIHYQIISKSNSEGVPYSDTFELRTNTCLTMKNEKQTIMKISINIKFIKSLWSVTKQMIEKNILKTSQSFTNDKVHRLSVLFGIPVNVIDEQEVLKKISTSVSMSEDKGTSTSGLYYPEYGKILNFIIILLITFLLILLSFIIFYQRKQIVILKNELHQINLDKIAV